MNDHHGYVRQFFSDASPDTQVVECVDWRIELPTHAIIFTDGEEFMDDYLHLKKAGITLRTIKIAITRVINIKKATSFDHRISTDKYEYIGRGSYWGNPYSIPEAGNREEVIRKFKYDFDFEKFPHIDKSEVYKLAGKRLGCFCKPEACHGDVIADYLNSCDDGK
nr:DUF4326 domain-containing protein [Photobacterium damselae]